MRLILVEEEIYLQLLPEQSKLLNSVRLVALVIVLLLSIVMAQKHFMVICLQERLVLVKLSLRDKLSALWAARVIHQERIFILNIAKKILGEIIFGINMPKILFMVLMLELGM